MLGLNVCLIGGEATRSPTAPHPALFRPLSDSLRRAAPVRFPIRSRTLSFSLFPACGSRFYGSLSKPSAPRGLPMAVHAVSIGGLRADLFSLLLSRGCRSSTRPISASSDLSLTISHSRFVPLPPFSDSPPDRGGAGTVRRSSSALSHGRILPAARHRAVSVPFRRSGSAPGPLPRAHSHASASYSFAPHLRTARMHTLTRHVGPDGFSCRYAVVFGFRRAAIRTLFSSLRPLSTGFLRGSRRHICLSAVPRLASLSAPFWRRLSGTTRSAFRSLRG